MSEQKNVSLYQQQKAIKPLIEDVIPEYLDGNMRKSAMDFIAHMRANKMKPAWCLTNQWIAACKTRTICRITLNPWNPFEKRTKWVVTAYLEHINNYEQTIIDENLQRAVWDHVVYCVQKPVESLPPVESRNYGVGMHVPCNRWNCAPGKNMTICGKELTNICRNGNRQYFWCHDPDKATLSAIKRLLELEQKARTESRHKT